MAPPGLSNWARAQRTLQPFEAWQTFQDWIERANPRFQFSVARNLVAGRDDPGGRTRLGEPDARGSARPHGAAAAARHDPVPADDAVPGAACAASRYRCIDPLRDRITCLCAHGGLTGVPQVSLPGATVDGLPVGLSIIGPRGSDASLVAVARRWSPSG